MKSIGPVFACTHPREREEDKFIAVLLFFACGCFSLLCACFELKNNENREILVIIHFFHVRIFSGFFWPLKRHALNSICISFLCCYRIIKLNVFWIEVFFSSKKIINIERICILFLFSDVEWAYRQKKTNNLDEERKINK